MIIVVKYINVRSTCIAIIFIFSLTYSVRFDPVSIVYRTFDVSFVQPGGVQRHPNGHCSYCNRTDHICCNKRNKTKPNPINQKKIANLCNQDDVFLAKIECLQFNFVDFLPVMILLSRITSGITPFTIGQ